MSRLMLPCWLLLACGEKEPCWGLEKGHTYFVDVLSAYGPESEYTWDPSVGVDLPSCGLNLDVQVGTTLGFKIVEQVDAPAGSPCLKSGAQVSGLTDAFEIPAGIGALGPSIDRTGPVTIASGAKINGCVGSWGMALLDVGAGAPFAAPFPGEPPPVVLLRGFQPAPQSPECIALFGDLPALCADEFVVHVRKN